jgi:hypothetical protein
MLTTLQAEFLTVLPALDWAFFFPFLSNKWHIQNKNCFSFNKKKKT